MPFVAFVANRVHEEPAGGLGGKAAGRLDEDLVRALQEVYRDQQRLARHDARALARLEADTREPLLRVPELEADVHHLPGLLEIGELMLGQETAPARKRRAAATRGR